MPVTKSLSNAAKDRVVEYEQIDQLLNEEEFRYQSIPLPDGRQTPGDDRSATLNLILPARLDGKSVLDIGCRYGYFSFEAAKRGAIRVVGVDFDEDALAKADKLNFIMKSKVEFRNLDISKQSIDETFDYVICLNVLHHLQDPLSILKKLIAQTRECLVLEIAGLTGKDAKKIFDRGNLLSWLLYPIPFAQKLLNKLPVIILGAENRAFEANFFFSPAALHRLLVAQNNLFWKVNIFPSPFKGRFICVAEKLRIGELLVVSGPSASGKSHLIQRLLRGECPELDPVIGEKGEKWLEAQPHHIDELPASYVPKLAYHYDFLRPYLRGPFNLSRDRATDVFELTDSLKSVTIIVDPNELHNRWHRREIEPRTLLGLYWGRKRSKRLLKALADRAEVIKIYDRWIDFISQRRGEHYLLDTRSVPYKLLPLADWQVVRAAL
jgi:SAM-dependent methyltransferase